MNGDDIPRERVPVLIVESPSGKVHAVRPSVGPDRHTDCGVNTFGRTWKPQIEGLLGEVTCKSCRRAWRLPEPGRMG